MGPEDQRAFVADGTGGTGGNDGTDGTDVQQVLDRGRAILIP